DTRPPSGAGGNDRGAAAKRDALAARERDLDGQLAAFDEPVRQRIVARRKTSPVPALELPRPIACWEFDGELTDSIGELHGTAHGGARVEGGRLILDGKDSYVATAPLKADLAARSLEVWISLGSLDQRGGGGITIESSTGAIFDSIVFGEKEPGQWMAGS